MTVKNGKLGCTRSPHDHRTVRLELYMNLSALPEPPESVDWASKVQEWGWLLNDKIGCCAIAGPAHGELAWTANDSDSGGAYCPSEADVLRAYSDVSGYRQGRPSTDVGCNMLDVMKYWVKRGIGRSKISAYARLNHRTESGKKLFRSSLHMFGGLHLGLNMPAAWEKPKYEKFWQAPKDPRFLRGEWEPGSWGGHAVNVVGYTPKDVTVVTWGRTQRLSWKALDVYCFETWVPLGSGWFGPDKTTPSGFDAARLASDLATIR